MQAKVLVPRETKRSNNFIFTCQEDVGARIWERLRCHGDLADKFLDQIGFDLAINDCAFGFCGVVGWDIQCVTNVDAFWLLIRIMLVGTPDASYKGGIRTVARCRDADESARHHIASSLQFDTNGLECRRLLIRYDRSNGRILGVHRRASPQSSSPIRRAPLCQVARVRAEPHLCEIHVQVTRLSG
jgi:hypothetical protein